VIDAAKSGPFVASEEQRSAAVRAVVLDEADFAVAVAERDELLAQHQDADGIAVGRGRLFGEHGRQPVLTEQVAHRGARADATDQLIFFLGQHDGSTLSCD